VTGFGCYVLFNWFQQLRLADRAAFALIALSPSLMIALMVGSLQSAINYGVMGFTPSFLINTYGMSPTRTGLTFGFLSAALGVIGPMIAGPVSDWANRRLPAAGRIWVTVFALGLSPLIALFVYRAPDPAQFFLRFTLYSLVLTMWLPPLYSAFYELVLPRMRGTTSGFYTILSTIIGLGSGPYFVGMMSDRNGGDLGGAILTINWVSPLIVLLLIVLALRIRRDEANLLAKARAAGEPV
jgi:MFS family permease